MNFRLDKDKFAKIDYWLKYETMKSKFKQWLLTKKIIKILYIYIFRVHQNQQRKDPNQVQRKGKEVCMLSK